jgi:diguanylate cyclase (GGDEF)-like protein
LRAPRLLAQVSPAQPGALLLIDIDNFKSVNDLFGHTAGDRLLIALSEMIRAVVPHGALAARLGGDEFVILLNSASTEQIVDLGSRLREQFFKLTSQTFATPEPVTLSIGANLFDLTGRSAGRGRRGGRFAARGGNVRSRSSTGQSA